ncbi:STAS/SEC14 domain-containing protein [Pseudonocardia sp. RS11V-5]|uniref:STAS/SEC14 domain-containing protein n=1 Tax=Pseudonocardia terrae TaxID=2905831 RepID=UPI001E3E4974|nr:STAS/SEC14 domain-containing protein [Pseudonocardia terrae]MCE3554638.1 STAS/SEC14 domain-containing protein [Pseudonocardia terrae]
MIEMLAGLPAGVVGLRVGGLLTPQDFDDVVAPMIEQARAGGARLRCLIEIDDDFRGLTPPAVLADVRLGLQTVGAYDGVAVVTNLGWVARPTQWAGFVVPFPMRVFPRTDRSPAADWLAALPAGARIQVALDETTGVATAEVSEALRIEDFESLAAAVDPWMARHGELRGLVLHVRSVPGWTSLGSVVRHVQFVVGHQGKIGRVALATDIPVAPAVASVAGYVVHPQVHVFPYADLAAAQVWAAAS